MLFHFTDTARLPWIIAAGELRPGKNKLGGFPDPDFLWATTSPLGDRTSSLPMDAYRAGAVNLVRLKLSASDFFPWHEVLERSAQWREEHVRALEATARHVGVDPKAWWCRNDALSMAQVQEVHMRTYNNKTWRPVDTAIKSYLIEGTRWLGLECLGGRVSRQLTHPDGRLEYRIGNIAA